ncbi:MAG: hypothetical protein CMJ23_00970 [Phycisphaerae bacterium]|nr:hypothetical protein [Phycisphaerae bacterium]
MTHGLRGIPRRIQPGPDSSRGPAVFMGFPWSDDPPRRVGFRKQAPRRPAPTASLIDGTNRDATSL